jgi:hypothetical protein
MFLVGFYRISLSTEFTYRMIILRIKFFAITLTNCSIVFFRVVLKRYLRVYAFEDCIRNSFVFLVILLYVNVFIS